MSKKKVLPFNRHGGWTNNHDFFYEQAKSFFERAKELRATLEKDIEDLTQKIDVEDPGWDKFSIGSYISLITDEKSNQLDAFCVATQMFACMAIEAFLNYYGVRRLGEEYCKRNIERLGINQKLEILIAISTQVLLEDKEEISSIVKKMFERRNRLAHPKSKEIIKKGQFVPPEFINHFEQAELAIGEMVLFFERFQELDESINLSGSIGG